MTSISRIAPALALGAFLCSFPTQQSRAVIVSFAQPNYVGTPGASLVLDVVITYEPSDPTDLFSFGVQVLPEAGTAFALNSITVVPSLDFSGAAGAPAFIDPDPAVLGAKGSIDIFAVPLAYYTGALLVTYDMSFSTIGAYEMGLGLFNTLGPSEQIFVTEDGTVLDSTITFEPASVYVVSDPAADDDGDGMSVRAERLLGFDPDAFASRFVLTIVSRQAGKDVLRYSEVISGIGAYVLKFKAQAGDPWTEVDRFEPTRAQAGPDFELEIMNPTGRGIYQVFLETAP